MTEGNIPVGTIYELAEYPGQGKYRKISSTVTMALNEDGTDKKAESIHPFDDVEIIPAELYIHSVVNEQSAFEQRIYQNQTSGYHGKIEIVVYPRYDDQIRVKLNSPGLGFSLTPSQAKDLHDMLGEVLEHFK